MVDFNNRIPSFDGEDDPASAVILTMAYGICKGRQAADEDPSESLLTIFSILAANSNTKNGGIPYEDMQLQPEPDGTEVVISNPLAEFEEDQVLATVHTLEKFADDLLDNYIYLLTCEADDTPDDAERKELKRKARSLLRELQWQFIRASFDGNCAFYRPKLHMCRQVGCLKSIIERRTEDELITVLRRDRGKE